MEKEASEGPWLLSISRPILLRCWTSGPGLIYQVRNLYFFFLHTDSGYTTRCFQRLGPPASPAEKGLKSSQPATCPVLGTCPRPAGSVSLPLSASESSRSAVSRAASRGSDEDSLPQLERREATGSCHVAGRPPPTPHDLFGTSCWAAALATVPVRQYCYHRRRRCCPCFEEAISDQRPEETPSACRRAPVALAPAKGPSLPAVCV